MKPTPTIPVTRPRYPFVVLAAAALLAAGVADAQPGAGPSLGTQKLKTPAPAAVPAAPAAAESQAVRARPTIAVLPLIGDLVEERELGLVFSDELALRLEAAGLVNVMTPRQVNAVLRNQQQTMRFVRDPAGVRNVARALGTQIAVFGTLSVPGDEARITITAVETAASGAPLSTVVNAKAASLAEAYETGFQAAFPLLGKVVASSEKLRNLGLSGITQAYPKKGVAAVPKVPLAALRRYARCVATVADQPLGAKNNLILYPEAYDEALAACSDAAKADKNFVQAAGGVALLHALKGDAPAAEAALKDAKLAQTFVPFAELARFWLFKRAEKLDDALKVLRQAVTPHPGYLLFRGYVAETLNLAGRHKEALAEFEQYLKASPRHPWVLSQIGYTYAKLGNHDKAIEYAKLALAEEPERPEWLLELASRYVDAKRWDDAIATLEPLAPKPVATGEVWLRLGYAYLNAGKLNEARGALSRAIIRAYRPADWRTRARAHVDIAKIQARSGKKDDAIKHLQSARAEGYNEWDRIKGDADFAAIKTDPRFQAVSGS